MLRTVHINCTPSNVEDPVLPGLAMPLNSMVVLEDSMVVLADSMVVLGDSPRGVVESKEVNIIRGLDASLQLGSIRELELDNSMARVMVRGTGEMVGGLSPTMPLGGMSTIRVQDKEISLVGYLPCNRIFRW